MYVTVTSSHKSHAVTWTAKAPAGCDVSVFLHHLPRTLQANSFPLAEPGYVFTSVLCRLLQALAADLAGRDSLQPDSMEHRRTKWHAIHTFLQEISKLTCI